MKAAVKTAVIYARYSSNEQKDRSIDDQIASCKQIAIRHGFKVVDTFIDRAKSGASMFERDGLLALMTAAKKRGFSFVITESLSRLSRDLEDTPAVYKRLTFLGIKIIDSNGEVSDIHIGVGGIVNSQFLKNLAISVTRGREARVREGLIPGKVAYGYAKVPGKPGARMIDQEKARIVLRIFQEYANGCSTRTIAVRLMDEGVVSPVGTKFWNHQKLISGGVGGLLGNPLYVGKLVWNTMQQVRNPETGKRNNRKSEKPPIEVDVPHLRIVPQDLWDRVQAMRAKRRKHMDEGRGPRVTRMGDKDRLLMGLLTCAECGARMMIGQANMDGSPRVVCGYGYRRTNCTHKKSYCLKTLTQKTLDDVKLKLTDPARLIKLAKAYHERHAERQRTYRGEREITQKQYNKVTVSLDRIVNAIGMLDGEPVEALVEKMKVLRIEKAALQNKLNIIEAQTNVVELRPAAIDKFSKAVKIVHEALTGDHLDEDHLAPFQLAFHNMIHSVVVYPTPKRAEYKAEPILRVSAVNSLEIDFKVPSIEEMLAEQGVDASKITSVSKNCRCPDRNSEGLMSLGLWEQAA
jgi:DNA invertase Pin-like site-specific DNA recombinase